MNPQRVFKTSPFHLTRKQSYSRNCKKWYPPPSTNPSFKSTRVRDTISFETIELPVTRPLNNCPSDSYKAKAWPVDDAGTRSSGNSITRCTLLPEDRVPLTTITRSFLILYWLAELSTCNVLQNSALHSGVQSLYSFTKTAIFCDFSSTSRNSLHQNIVNITFYFYYFQYFIFQHFSSMSRKQTLFNHTETLL